MKAIPFLPLLSLFCSTILLSLYYNEVDIGSDNVLLVSFVITLATSFAYWMNPCPKVCRSVASLSGSLQSEIDLRFFDQPETSRWSFKAAPNDEPSEGPQDEHNKHHDISEDWSSEDSYDLEHTSGVNSDDSQTIPVKKVALLIYQRTPEIKFLHMDMLKWCMVTGKDCTPEDALKNISKMTGISTTKFKVDPHFNKYCESVNVSYLAAEVPQGIRVNLKPDEFEWVGVKESLARAQDCQILSEVMIDFISHLDQEKPSKGPSDGSESQEPYQTLNLIDDINRGEMGTWYKHPEDDHFIRRLLPPSPGLDILEMPVFPEVEIPSMAKMNWSMGKSGKSFFGNLINTKLVLIGASVVTVLLIFGVVYCFKPEIFNNY